MKQTFKVLTLLLAFSVLFTNCKKEEDDGPTTDPNAVTGTFSDGTTTYTFKGAFGEKYGADPTIHEGFNIDLVLYSDGLTVTFVGGEVDTVYGQGAVIYLEAFTSAENAFADGTYTFSDTEPHPLFTFSDFSDYGVGDYNTFNINYNDYTGGTYTITTLSDGRRNITFNLNLDNGKKLTGTFSGPISYL